MNKIIYLLKYDHSKNIWDVIQSLSSKKILENLWYKVNFIDQNKLHKPIWKKIKLFLNGFFCFDDNDFSNTFPFHSDIIPIFSNIHLELDYWKQEKLEKYFFNKKNIEYLKKYEPIWCRDQATSDILNKYNIKAINNSCITLLFNKRTKNEAQNATELILVDVDEYIPIPKEYKNNYTYITQYINNWDRYLNKTKLQIAEDLLNYYKKNAKLVITSRFHCAIPCIAMWIPVILLWENNKRLKQNFVDIYPYIHFWKRHKTLFRKLNFSKNIPILNINIKYWFNILDVIYSVLYKVILNILYKFNIIKVNWDIKEKNIENFKKEQINNIIKILKWI